MRSPPHHLLGAVSLAGLLVACSPEEPAAVRIGIVVWPPYELFYLARDLGHYDDVAVDLVDYTSPVEALRAYRNGLVDAVAMTADFLVQIADQEPGHRAVLVIDVSQGGDCVIARPEVADLADLRGRRIGLEMSTLGQYVLARALEKTTLTLDDVSLRFVDIPDHVASFETDEVDAVVTYEPVRTALLARGGRLLFDSREIPGEIVDVLITRTDVLAERERTLAAVVDGFFRARDHFLAHPQEAAERLAGRETLTPAELLHTFTLVHLPDRAENVTLLGGDQPGLSSALDRIAPLMVRHGKIRAPLASRDLLDDRLFRDAPR